MKKNRMSQRVLPLFLTAAMILNMYNLTVLAEAETPEMPETAELPEESEAPEDAAAPEEPKIPEDAAAAEEPERSEEPEVPEKAESPEKPELPTMSENSLTVSENSVADIAVADKINMCSNLDDSALEEYIVRGQSPEGAVVNLFDYWQTEREGKEYIWDWETGTGEICNMGISREHLLRFGQTKTTQEEIAKWNYGEWNRYSAGPYQGIVQNTLDGGFPKLNFKERATGDFGNYADNYPGWLDDAHREESLAYLFSVTEQNSYKASYAKVQGLFQMDKGYYYYDSQKNFAEFDEANSRFILYNSPGIGKEADSGSKGYFGQFFPFNKASQVFDTVYDDITDEHPYHLSYIGEEEPNDEKGETEEEPDDETEKTGEEADNETGETEEKTDYVVRNGKASFLSCTYPDLNHYIGMTLEVPFLQTLDGKLSDGSDMTFEFSGDDDVWIFIDDVLVADLGGIHDAYELSINFADGMVLIMDKEDHTLFDSFKEANQSVDDFSGNTFADNTEHTLKMFYLERGHMASNLSLRFNLQNARYHQIKKVDQNGNPMSGVEFALYPAKVCDSTDAGSILCSSTGTPCYVKQDGTEPLLTLETGATGMADIIGHSFGGFSTNFYILRETGAPAGYRSGPVDIVLEHNSETAKLSVANKWQTGAYVEEKASTATSCICIPNEQRELRVKKVNEDGEPLNGAGFGIYESREAAELNRAPVAEGRTASVTDKDGTVEEGVLIFKPQLESGSGYAQMVWPDAVNKTYYLREISGPSGYTVNPTIVPIVIGTYSVYADAGTVDDGVSVEAGVGRLSQHMVKYAAEDEADITLRDITAIAQEQDSGNFKPDSWTDRVSSGQKEKMDLHYGINSKMGMNYGLHKEASEAQPFFKTETGFLRARVIQNVDALQGKKYEEALNNANWVDLGNTDITGLFSLLNVVVVEDQKSNDPSDDDPSDDDPSDDDPGDDDLSDDDPGGGDPGDDPEDPPAETENPEGVPGAHSDSSTHPTGSEQAKSSIASPQTGDDSMIGWWAALNLMSLLGICATVYNLILRNGREKKRR